MLELREVGIITHMSKIDALISGLESSGFTWIHDSIRGLFYQLHMPAEMTRAINKELDAKYDETNVNFSLTNIKGVIQTYLAREKTASETISISNLSTQTEMMAINTPRQFTQQYTPTKPPPSHLVNDTPRFAPGRSKSRINPQRWQRGSSSWTTDSGEQMATHSTTIAIPQSAVVGAKSNLTQCFFCGNFGHSYNEGTCSRYNGTGDQTATHWKDWRKVVNNKFYSLNALYPH